MTRPSVTYRCFGIGGNTNHWVHFLAHADVGSPVRFAALVIAGAYPSRSFDPGPKTYTPFGTGLPPGLPGPSGVPFVRFSYRTKIPVDPGPFVFIA